MADTIETREGARNEATESTGQQLQGTQAGSGQAGRELQQTPQGGAVQPRSRGGLTQYARDPFEMMQRLSEEMDEVFGSFFHGRPFARSSGQSQLRNVWAPEVEVSEEGNQLRICVDLPGVPRDNVKVELHDGMLTIHGERREERTEGGEQQGFRRSERRYGSFYRSIPLPEGADTENAEAHMKEGVLEVKVPVATKPTRRLEIQ